MQPGWRVRPGGWSRRGAAFGVALALLVSTAGAALALTPLPPRDLDRSVYDAAGVIDAGHEAAMEAMHAALFRKTGVAIVTVAVPALVDETIEDFAVRVGTEWGVGRRGADRGLVVAFAGAERAIYVATGYGVEGYLPDGKVGAILDQRVLPHLRQDDVSTGLYQASAALVAASAEEHGVTISGAEPQAPTPAREPSRWTAMDWVVRGLIALVFLYVLIRHPRLLLFWLMAGALRGGRGNGGFGNGGGFGGFGGGGFGGGGAGRRF